MKSTGVTRKIDPLGRIVIPKELRRTLGMEENPFWKYVLKANQSFYKNIFLKKLV